MTLRRPCLCLCLCAQLVGCLDLEALRARAGDGGAGDASTLDGDGDVEANCTDSDRRAIRLWMLGLGESHFVTLRNTGECSIELGGLRLLFDDVDDCSIQLPAVRLAPGAEVRVREAPEPEDISLLDDALGECAAGVTYDPERGGVTYLCDGACGPETVLDVLAHAGERHGAPAVGFGQAFDRPVEGVTVAKREVRRLRRVALEGVAPSFVGSDWKLELLYVYAGFEGGFEVVVDGVAQSWIPEEGQNATFSTSEIAAVGDAALSLTHRGNIGRSDGLAIELPEGRRIPSHVSYFTRFDTLKASGAYFDLQGNGFSAIQGSFEPQGLGTEIENGHREQVLVAKDAWHQVEFRNVDWLAHTYDLYIDRVLVAPSTRFWSNASGAEKLSLYSFDGGTTAYWDEIELWRDATPLVVAD